MFEHFRHYNWVLKPFLYQDPEQLIFLLQKKVIAPVEARLRRSRRSIS